MSWLFGNSDSDSTTGNPKLGGLRVLQKEKPKETGEGEGEGDGSDGGGGGVLEPVVDENVAVDASESKS